MSDEYINKTTISLQADHHCDIKSSIKELIIYTNKTAISLRSGRSKQTNGKSTLLYQKIDFHETILLLFELK